MEDRMYIYCSKYLERYAQTSGTERTMMCEKFMKLISKDIGEHFYGRITKNRDAIDKLRTKLDLHVE